MALLLQLWPATLLAAMLVFLRLAIAPTTPTFTAADNPVAHVSKPLTKMLSIARLWAFHARLLLFPNQLSFDWSMDSIPLVESLLDVSNLETVALGLVLTGLTCRCYLGLTTERLRRSIHQPVYSTSTKFSNNISDPHSSSSSNSLCLRHRSCHQEITFLHHHNTSQYDSNIRQSSMKNIHNTRRNGNSHLLTSSFNGELVKHVDCSALTGSHHKPRTVSTTQNLWNISKKWLDFLGSCVPCVWNKGKECQESIGSDAAPGWGGPSSRLVS